MSSRRVALVTGGIGGLGSAVCRALAAQGCVVIAGDLAARRERVDAFRAEVAAAGLDIEFLPLDVADFDGCATAIQDIVARHGRLDILVNCAGITRDTTLRKMTPEQWRQVISVDLDGIFNTCRNAIEPMLAQGFGRIVNITSVNGQTGQFGQTNYAAAKAGLHGFTMSLAREVARKGITVNSVAPGYCATEMVMAVPEDIRAQILETVPVGRMGQPEEIARAVAFLAHDDAGFITGALLPVNGGLFISF